MRTELVSGNEKTRLRINKEVFSFRSLSFVLDLELDKVFEKRILRNSNLVLVFGIPGLSP